jgi:spore maturation protein SpmB
VLFVVDKAVIVGTLIFIGIIVAAYLSLHPLPGGRVSVTTPQNISTGGAVATVDKTIRTIADIPVVPP